MDELERQLRSYSDLLDQLSSSAAAADPATAESVDGRWLVRRPSRRRTTYVAVALSAALVAVLAVAIAFTGTTPKPAQTLTQPMSGQLVVGEATKSGSETYVLHDFATNTRRRLELPGLRAGSFPYRLSLLDSSLVYNAEGTDGGHTFADVMAYSLKDQRTTRLGNADWYVPSSDERSAWLVRYADDTAMNFEVQNVGLDGSVLEPWTPLPPGYGEPHPVAEGFLLRSFSTNHQQYWNLARRQFERDFGPDVGLVAIQGDRLALAEDCDDGKPSACQVIVLTNLETEASRKFGPPDDKTLRGWHFPGGSERLSSDGRLLALRALVSTPARLEDVEMNRLGVIDLESGSVSWVPQAEGSDYSPLAWSPDSRWLFFRNAVGVVLAYDTDGRETRTLRGNCCRGFPAVSVVSP